MAKRNFRGRVDKILIYPEAVEEQFHPSEEDWVFARDEKSFDDVPNKEQEELLHLELGEQLIELEEVPDDLFEPEENWLSGGAGEGVRIQGCLRENYDLLSAGECLIVETRGLEKRVFDLLYTKPNIPEAARIVNSYVPRVSSFVEMFVPEKAKPELRSQEALTAFGHCYGYWTDERGRLLRESLRLKRFGAEEELLKAVNPKRIERLWNELKKKLEEKYHRSFLSREDFAAMIGIYRKNEEFFERLDEMNRTLQIMDGFDCLAREEPSEATRAVSDFWRKYGIHEGVGNAASSLVTILRDMARPYKLFVNTSRTQDSAGNYIEFEHPVDLTHFNGHWSANWHGDINHDFGISNLLFFSHLLLRGKSEGLSFAEALELVHPGYAKGYGLKDIPFNIYHEHVPDEIEEMALQSLKRQYENRKPGDQVSRFLEKYSEAILARWKSTAIDHERIFDYHEPHYTDKRLMSIFWTIREGKKYSQYSKKEHNERRLNGVLEAMVADGVITSDKIDPPLRERYLKQDEVLTSVTGRALDSGRISSLVSLTMTRDNPVIATSVEARRMLPGDVFPKSEIMMSADLRELESALDPNKTYQVLYMGKHSLFLTSVEHWPNGEQTLGNIHRLTLLPEGVDPKRGKAIRIGPRRFNVTQEAAYSLKHEMEDGHFDAVSDGVPLNSVTVVTDVTPDVFKRDYFSDFIAHVMLYGPSIHGVSDFCEGIEHFERQKPCGLEIALGGTGRMLLKTFDLGGRFGFMIKNERGHGIFEEVDYIAQGLVGYIRDVGLPYHLESDLGESGRRTIERKLEDRKFMAEHLEAITGALRGEKLARVWAYLIGTREFDLFKVGVGNAPCEDCGKRYVGGYVINREAREQWIQGVKGGDLHVLSEHPGTFKFMFGNLRKIHHLLTKARDHPVPYLDYPEIRPALREFAELHARYVGANTESMIFYEETMGGASLDVEKEELEDNPKLRKLARQEERINQRQRGFEKAVYAKAAELQRMYDDLRGFGDYPRKEDWRVANYWGDQLLVMKAFQLSSPRMLPGIGESDKDLRVSFVLYHQGQ